MEMLEAFPRAGKLLRGDQTHEHREVSAQDQRIIYRVDGTKVRIRALVQARRDWDPRELTILP